MSFHPLSCFCLFLNEKFAVFLIFVPVYIMSVSLGYIKDFLFIKCFEQSDCSIQSQLGSTLWPHEMQHAKLPYSSLSPKVCSNSGPLSQWCHPTISSSVSPFSPCPQSFPASGSFSLSQLFTSSGQNIGASALASALPMNIQGWFPLGLTGLISLQSKGLSRVFSSTTVRKYLYLNKWDCWVISFGENTSHSVI